MQLDVLGLLGACSYALDCVDIYQALTEDRSYKKGMPHEKACQILKNMAEKGWLDASIVAQVDACFR